MSGTVVYFIGVICIVVGTFLTYWGNSLKSADLDTKVSTLKEQSLELIEGKNTLLQKNNELTEKIGDYQANLDEKEQVIQGLEEKARKAERGVTSIFHFNGTKRVTGPGTIEVTGGAENEVFREMQRLETEKNFDDLISICESQITETPEWLTPYLYLGVACANSGHKDRAIELLEYVIRHAAGDPAYAQAEDLLGQLRSQ